MADPERRGQIEIDVGVLAPALPGLPREVLSLGEAKWGERMGVRHVERLRRARDLLAVRGYDTSRTLLTCYSGVGFDAELDGMPDVLTVGLERLYAV